MPSLNQVNIIGHVGREPLLKTTAGGTPYCKFSIATNERWRDKSGQENERTEWHNVHAWAGLAEICATNLVKGMLVYVSGSLRTTSWDGIDGIRKTRTEIHADRVLFLGRKQQQSSLPPPEDDEIPF